MTTGVPANSSICRSFRLSPIAITSASREPAALRPGAKRRPFRTACRDDIDQREIAMLVFGQRDRKAAVRLRHAAGRSNSAPHLRASAREHHLDRILGQAFFQRRDFAQKGPVGGKEPAVARMLPVDRFEDDLALAGPIEHDRGAGAMIGHVARAPTRAISRGSRLRIRVCPSRVFTMAPLLRMSVSGAGKLFENRTREVVAPPGRQRDLDARSRSPGRSPRGSPPGSGLRCREACRQCRAR